MIYCVSDIHGMYSKFLKLLKKIDFNENDTLFVLGDICDRGAYPMKVLLRMMEYDNIIPICGNHDYIAAQCLKILSKEITLESLDELEDWQVDMINTWLYENGGSSTLQDFLRLSSEERNAVMRYFGEFIFYKEINVNGQDYILVHAGLGNDFEPNKPLEDYDIEHLLETRPNFSKKYFEDKIVVCGHTPTQTIEENPRPGQIYKANNYIAIDCGGCFGGSLAAICLDTGEELYID